MKMRVFNYFIVVFLGVVSSLTVLAAIPSAPIDKFISLSDIHFNPFSMCTSVVKTCETVKKLRAADYKEWDAIFSHDGEEQLATAGKDTNYPLFAATIEALLNVNQKQQPKFAIVLGDFLAHEFRAKYIAYSHDLSSTGYQAFVRKTLQFITYKLHAVMPNIDIYAVVGNNDSYNGDYYSAPNEIFYWDTAKTWAHLINNPINKKQLLSEFPSGGYYAVILPNTHNRLILLNTVLFSEQANGNNVKAAANQELVWLHQQLIFAAKHKQHVMIAFHVPPGIDVYNTLKNKLTPIEKYWKSEYQQVFLNELKNHAAIISGILPAHIHMDTFQLIKTGQADLPISFTPSVSPLFGNNPGFKVYRYHSESTNLKDFDTYYLPNKDRGWQKEYSFNQIYQPQCKDCNLVTGMQQLTPANHLVQYFKQYYAVGNNAQPITQHDDWMPYYWCNLRELNVMNYSQCVETAGHREKK